jgi:(p)ppGpp synthase/HD superfamily hydrolase
MESGKIMSELVPAPLLSARFAEAFALAQELHAHQVRKGTEVPYISHLMAVTALVLEDGGTESEAIAALLHDAVEDQGGLETLALIRDRFGGEVAAMVEALSDAVVVPKPPWRERKELILTRLQGASMAVLRIAIADRLHNASSQLMDYQRMGEGFWERFNAPKAEILWALQAFIQLCQERGVESRNLSQLERIFQALNLLGNE